MPSTIAQQTIAEINDRFRKAVFYRPQPKGKAVVTRGIAALDEETKKRIFRAVANHTEFDASNDPHSEHDFGKVELPAVPKCFWKIDYYDSKACQYGADDPASPTTYRIIVIMFASEY